MLVKVLSISERNESARSSLILSKALRAARSFLRGDLDALLVESGMGCSYSLSSVRSTESRRAVRGLLTGECESFQLLITSWLQYASMLGRCGVGGIRYRLDGDSSFFFVGLHGGVAGGGFRWILRGDLSRGGELER